MLIDRDSAKLAEACAQLGAGAFALETDLLSRESVDALAERIVDLAGGLDIFHANAGAYVGGVFADEDPDDWEFMLSLNVNAALRSVRAVLPQLVAQKSGDVVMTSSIAGYVPVVWEPVYTASKFAVTSFAHALRRQVGPSGVRVGNIAPGPVLTPLIDDWPAAKKEEAFANGSLLRAEDVAEAVLFMVTRRAGVAVRDLVVVPTSLDL